MGDLRYDMVLDAERHRIDVMICGGSSSLFDVADFRRTLQEMVVDVGEEFSACPRTT